MAQNCGHNQDMQHLQTSHSYLHPVRGMCNEYCIVTHMEERETEKKEDQAGHQGLITTDNDITYR
jgi:hypothetical protein